MVENKGKQAVVEKQGRKPWALREVGGKPVWDWLDLLLVPLVLGIVAVGLSAWFNWQQDTRQNDIEDRRSQAERELAEQRAQDEALQAYLDEMSNLLLEKDLRDSQEGSEVRTLARARTLTVLGRLDPSHKTSVIQFLDEADLVHPVDKESPVMSLKDADLGGADLSFVTLKDADLRGADLNKANLKDADLSEANLGHAKLQDADLYGAKLQDAALNNANLQGAYLRGADLRGANLAYADLSRADLGYAKLQDADLQGAKLQDASLQSADLLGADLLGADLAGADLIGVEGATTSAKLQRQAKSLKDARMPSGQKYENWLKDREGRKEDAENE